MKNNTPLTLNDLLKRFDEEFTYIDQVDGKKRYCFDYCDPDEKAEEVKDFIVKAIKDALEVGVPVLSSSGSYFIVSFEDYERVSARSWSVSSDGYIRTTENHKNLPLARWLLDAPEDKEVDHINGVKADNRRENLRLCTPSENKSNRGLQKNNKLGVKGIHFGYGKFQANIKKDGKRHYLGAYKTIQEAVDAYNKAARELHGEFAKLTDTTQYDENVLKFLGEEEV